MDESNSQEYNTTPTAFDSQTLRKVLDSVESQF